LKLSERVVRLVKRDPISVGLDIGNHSVKLVYIQHSIKGPVLQGVGIHVFKKEIMVNGEIKNREELLLAITSLINKTDPSGRVRQVNFSLSWSYGVIADRIKLKSSSLESDDELILMEASTRSPFDVEDIQLDYKILTRNEKTSDIEVLLVAAKLDIMQPFLSLVRDSGLDPVNIDVDTFATANAYLFSAQEQDNKEVICLANIGENVTNLTFIKNGKYHSTRDVGTGGSYFVSTLEKNLGVDTIEATAILKSKEIDEKNNEEIKRCIENCTEELSMGLDLALGYFQSSENNVQIDKIYLCGGGANIQNLPELLHERHNIPVEIADPLQDIAFDKRKFTGNIPKDISTTLMVATGLALRKF